MITNHGYPNFQSRENLIVVSGQTAGYFFQEWEALERFGIMAFKWAFSAIIDGMGSYYFWTLQRNRELEVLCSCHSIAFEATRSDAAQYGI